MLTTVNHSIRGLGLLVNLNWDRFLSVGMTALAIAIGAYIMTF